MTFLKGPEAAKMMYWFCGIRSHEVSEALRPTWNVRDEVGFEMKMETTESE
jgi:hypothetical protein